MLSAPPPATLCLMATIWALSVFLSANSFKVLPTNSGGALTSEIE